MAAHQVEIAAHRVRVLVPRASVTDRRAPARIVAVALLLFALSSAVAVYRVRHDAARWEPDAAIYLRMALQDRGLSRSAAKSESDAFLRTTSEADNPTSRGFYADRPPAYYATQFDLFRGRPLYPALGAALYPRFGPHGLQIVSGAAYALAVPLLFVVLLAFGPWWAAALGAVAFAAARPVLDMASYGMTDELALLFWVAALGAMLAYVRRPRALMLAVVVAASLALTFTRPAVYLPFGAALGALVAMRGAARATAARLLVATAAVGVVFAAYTVLAHAPGLSEQLRWQYDWQRAVGATTRTFASWYALAEARGFGEAFGVLIYRDGAVYVVALAVLGAAALRRTPAFGVLAGALIAALIAVVANPLEVVRTVELPWLPVLLAFATAALARFRTA